jgi:hypothetical protein
MSMKFFENKIEKMLALCDKHEIRNEERTAVLNWAENILFDCMLLDLVLDEEIILELDDEGEMVFTALDDKDRESINIKL